MKLWTIQSTHAWAELMQNGVLRAKRRHIAHESWQSAYEWMARKMNSQIGPPPEPDCYPIWAWYQWEGHRKKPDLRYRAHIGKGEQGVRLEIDCPDSRAVLSNFDLWHYVLNYWYVPTSEADGLAFEAELAGRGLSFFHQKPLPDESYHRSIVDSWDRIFDLEWIELDICEPRDEVSIQATLWEIRLDQVRDHTHFTSR